MSTSGRWMSSAAAVRLVAWREISERARDRSFAISTALTLVILLGIVLVPRLLDLGDDGRTVGVSGPDAAELAAAIEVADVGETIEVRRLGGEAQGKAGVEDGTLDAALVGGRIVVASELPEDLNVVLQAAAARVEAERVLEEAGLSPAQVEQVLAPAPLPVEALEEPDSRSSGNETIAFITVIVLYGQIIGYGFWVGSGVVEEKASRVVEIVLSAITPRQLLAGKVIGIGLLGLSQLVAIAAVAVGVAIASGAVDVPADVVGTVGIAVGFFVLGYALYACLFAAAASAIARVEELQNAMTPLTLVIVGSLVLALIAAGDPGSALAAGASLVPPFSTMVMPPRIAGGEASGWEIALAIGLLLASVAAIVPLAARIYENAVLQTRGRVRLRDAWRAGR